MIFCNGKYAHCRLFVVAGGYHCNQSSVSCFWYFITMMKSSFASAIHLNINQGFNATICHAFRCPSKRYSSSRGNGCSSCTSTFTCTASYLYKTYIMHVSSYLTKFLAAKRFFKEVSVVSSGNHYELTLDSRKLKTPMGNEFKVVYQTTYTISDENIPLPI